MTKAELISLISKNTGVEKTEVLNIVTAYMDTIKTSLAEGENVYLRGFGSFIVKTRAEKKARNISKNTTITIPEHNIPAFKPAKVFMEVIANDKKKAKKKK
ncbi:MAG TPA: integration host factor subunit beta [Porphyromonadaceae bacterium]|nr:integration host factor subunit beta [Porphyromonadaceae bacterium]